jgi:hypothetical protein
MEQKSGRGRKPVGDKPMTTTERTRLHRQRRREAGYRWFTIRLSPQLVGQMEFFRKETEPDISFQKFFEAILVNFLQEGTTADEATFYNELTRQYEEEKQYGNQA